MTASAHAYVRGNTKRFYEWLAGSRGRSLPVAPTIWMGGDCHVGNLGPVAATGGEIAIGLRDLDQTVIGSPAHDVVRLTDNTSVKQAIDGAEDVDRVFVPLPRSARAHAGAARLGSRRASGRNSDSRAPVPRPTEAYAVNATLAKLEAAIPDPVARAAVLRAFGWGDRRTLEIVEIRPAAPLEGGPFDGLLSRRLREDYVASGREVARAWLSA